MGAKGFYFGALNVDGPTGARWNAALQLLREGRSVLYRGVAVSLAEPGLIVVEVPAWVELADMPESIAARDLANAEDLISGLQTDSAFGDLTSGRRIEVRLVNESYGWIYARYLDGHTSFTELWSRHRRAK